MEDIPVSVVVPARNEEANIADAVETLVRQTVTVEVIVVNDASTDRTGRVLADLQQRLPQLRVLEVEGPPPGWTGKAYAVARGAEQARALPWMVLHLWGGSSGGHVGSGGWLSSGPAAEPVSRALHLLLRARQRAVRSLVAPFRLPTWERRDCALEGKCANAGGHGHNYALEVTVTGEPDPRTGMVVDLTRLDAFVEREVLQPFDLSFLNADAAFSGGRVPTTENLCVEIYHRLHEGFRAAAVD